MASLTRYRRIEARHAVGRLPLLGLGAGALLLMLTQVITPLLPPAILGFLELAFRVRGLGAIILLNDYLALYTVLFFSGAAQLLQVVVVPREEQQLDLLLAKPLPPATLLSARVLPVLGSVAGVGVLLSLGCALAVAPYGGADASVAGALGAGLLITAVVVGLLALMNLAFLPLRDSFQALLLAFGAWVSPLLPCSVFLYRPDLFEGRGALTSALVAPANLIWLDGDTPLMALAGGILATAVTVGLLRVSGWGLSRLDLS